MKNFILLFVLFFMGTAILLCILEIENHSVRKEEVRSSISEGVEKSVSIHMNDKKNTINSKEEFLADFVQSMTYTLKSNSKVMIQVWNADKDKGSLAVKVNEAYKNFTGGESMIASDKMAIFNQVKQEDQKTWEVNFYQTKQDMIENKNVYKSYAVLAGECIVTPANPTNSKQQFLGWLDSSDYNADFSQPITENRKYYANWKK